MKNTITFYQSSLAAFFRANLCHYMAIFFRWLTLFVCCNASFSILSVQAETVPIKPTVIYGCYDPSTYSGQCSTWAYLPNGCLYTIVRTYTRSYTKENWCDVTESGSNFSKLPNQYGITPYTWVAINAQPASQMCNPEVASGSPVFGCDIIPDANRCPAGFTQDANGTSCSRPDCSVSQVRDITGACSDVEPDFTSPPSPDKNLPDECPSSEFPINYATGTKSLTEPDYVGASMMMPDFVRRYHSQLNGGKRLGKNWLAFAHSQVVAPSNVSNNGDQLIMVRANGVRIPFNYDGTSWSADADVIDILLELKNSNGTRSGWEYRVGASNIVEKYAVTGQLVSLTKLSGLTHTMTYSDANTPSNIAPAAGLLIGITDDFGRKLSFTYDSANRISTMVNPAGAIYQYAYSNDNLLSVTFPDNSIKQYHYEDASHPNALTGITDENNDRYMTYSYDANGRAFDEISPNIGTDVNHYTMSYQPGVSTTVTQPNRSNQTYHFTTILGAIKSTGQDQPAGSGCAASGSNITYDVNGNVSTKTDFNGNLTQYHYDMSRNLETTRVEGLDTAGNVQTETRTITTSWNGAWRLPQVVSEYTGGADENGLPSGTLLRKTTTWYDNKGNLTHYIVNDAVENKSRETTITYTYSTDVPGLILSKMVNGPRTDISDISTYDYYPHDATCEDSTATPIIDPITGVAPPNLGCRGQLQTMTNALGHQTTYDRYNHHGQLEQMTDPNALVTQYTYDLRQRLITRTVAVGTAQAALTQFEYDKVGQLKKINKPDNSFVIYDYDVAHRLTDITDTLGNSIHYTLNSESNIEQTDYKNADGTLIKQDKFEYDALSRLEKVIDGNNNSRTLEYDSNGNLKKIIDAKLEETNLTIDKLNRTTLIKDALQNITQTDYNAIDQSILIKAPNNAQTTYDVNAFGDINSETSLNRGELNYDYDNAGNLKTLEDARGVVSSITWDALNRPLTTDYPLSGENIAYTWDATPSTNTCTHGIGRLCAITDGIGTTTFAYDERGNLLTKSRTIAGGSPRVTQYKYDLADNLSTTITPSNKQINLQRDDDGAVQQVSATTNNGVTEITSILVKDIQTNVIGKTQYQRFGNNVPQRYTYNLLGALSNLDYITQGNGDNNAEVPTLPEWAMIIMGSLLMFLSFRKQKNSSRKTIKTSHLFSSMMFIGTSIFLTMLTSFSILPAIAGTLIEYDENQNVKTYTHTEDNNTQHSTSFTYDALNRLETENGPFNTQSFGYDANSNRESDGSGAYTYLPNSNRLNTINGQNIVTDDAGYITSANGYTYEWNQAGQLKAVKLGSTLLASYQYNYKGLRVLKTTTAAAPQGAMTIEYSYDERNQLLTEIKQPNDYLYTYVWRDDIPVSVIIHPAGQQLANPAQSISNADQIIYFETDHLNTPRVGRDQQGNIVWQWHSDAFGTTQANSDPDQDAFQVTINLRFPGQYYDQESQLHYNYFRYYDPATGRYLQSDPIGLAGGINTYGYALGNPLLYIDPTGRAVPAAVAACMANPACAAAALATTATVANACKNTYDLVSDYLKNNPNVIFNEEDGNNNPYDGPVDEPVIVVDDNGNAIPVDEGESINSSPNGDYQQVIGPDGRPTGDRLDRGGHRNQNDPRARDPHAHRPGITTPDGNPHLPIR